MTRVQPDRHYWTGPGSRHRGGITGGLLAIALLLLPAAAAAQVTADANDQQCLNCHAMTGLTKTLGNGEKMSLHVSRDAYAGSVHAAMGCTACHRDVNPARHPVMRDIASRREFSLARANVCRGCHAAKYEQYEGSIHANLVAAGDSNAPVCSSCHDAHAVRSRASYATIAGQPCKACHEDIFKAYEGSVHGLARASTGHLEAPLCSGCHQAHEVKAAATGSRLKDACLGCHEGALLAHDDWLPNSRLHLNVVACPACHAPAARRAVDLRLYDNATGELVSEALGDARFEARARAIDALGDGLDPLELWTLVRESNREGENTDVTLHGRLEVRGGAEAHQLAARLDAVRDCDSCHRSGADPFGNVTISVTAPDGRRIRYAAGEETLTSAVAMDAVSGFYTAGGTRIRILDGLLVLAVIAGLAIPVTHMAARKWFKNQNG